MTTRRSVAETAERDARIIKLTQDGLSAHEVAAAVGVCDRTVHRARRRHGIPAAPKNYLTEAELSMAAAMLDDGASYGEVARTLGRSHHGILYHLPGRSMWKSGGGNEIRRYLAQLKSLPPLARTREGAA